MRKVLALSTVRLSTLVLALGFIAIGGPIVAQEQAAVDPGVAVESEVVQLGAATMDSSLVWSSTPPELTPDQLRRIEQGTMRTHLPGPPPGARQAVPVGPSSGSEMGAPGTMQDSMIAPAATPDAVSRFGTQILTVGGSKSNIMESSVAVGGKFLFYTGNWFAARGTKGGKFWSYVNPSSGMTDFCCDQVAIYDATRDIHVWLRMGSPTSGVNRFRLNVSRNGFASSHFWDFYPTGTNSGWTNQWWDYPHIQLGADYLYITWNMFSQAGSFVRSVVLRLPLDNLRAGTAFSYNYYNTTAWATFTPVSGAEHSMYFASTWPNSSPQNSKIGIWRWDEDATGLTSWIKTIPAWLFTNRGNALCGSTTGNWAARYDQRVLAGARYSLMTPNVKFRGRKVLAWWWNVQEGSGFARPYINGAAFFEDTMTLVPGNQGRPLVYSSSVCFAYPHVATNTRQDIAMVFNYAQSSDGYKPRVGWFLQDDYRNAWPGGTFYYLAGSTARPSDRVWGDYNTIRPHSPASRAWVMVAHRIFPSTTNCTRCSQPLLFVAGRERDRYSYFRWKKK